MKTTKSDLTAERLREVLRYDPETGVFTKRFKEGKWPTGHVVGSYDAHIGYVRMVVDGGYYLAHRLAWLYVHGEWPKEQIDHRNQNGQDNRIANLREATNALNCQNRGVRVDTPHGHKGVYWNKRLNKWVASAQIAGKQKHLGVYSDKEEAVQARRAAEAAHYPFLVTGRWQHA